VINPFLHADFAVAKNYSATTALLSVFLHALVLNLLNALILDVRLHDSPAIDQWLPKYKFELW